jgi:hypothetical protein
MVAVSVTDEAGTPVTGLDESAFATRILQAPAHGSATAVRDAFEEHSAGGPEAGQGFYSFVVKPSDEVGGIFVQDQVWVFVSVNTAGNRGQTLCLASFHLLG